MQQTRAITLHWRFATVVNDFLQNVAATALVVQGPVGFLGHPEAALCIKGHRGAEVIHPQGARRANQLTAQKFNFGRSLFIHILSLHL
ncbi:hypothetical protein D3C78_1383380 [compost metagenome]